MREPPQIAAESLRASLREHYAIKPASLEFLPLGLDYQAGVYRVTDARGEDYLLKVSARPLYAPSCQVPRALHDQGITSVVAPLPTRQQTLWARTGAWTLIAYPFINGDTSWTGMTDEQWREVGATFRRIHQADLPPSVLALLRKERFDPAEYTRQVEEFDARIRAQDWQAEESPSKRALGACWLEHGATIRAVAAALEQLAGELRARDLPFGICHADLHPANLLRPRAGRVRVVDWDEVMLAPKERDFLFIREASEDSALLPGAPKFFQGYGPTEIDWLALTYYRYERAAQDLIASAQEVLARPDLGEETKLDSAHLFQSILAAGGEIEAAVHTSTRLPTSLVAGIGQELTAREK